MDTHVWQVAVRYYTPGLKGKTLGKPVRSGPTPRHGSRTAPRAFCKGSCPLAVSPALSSPLLLFEVVWRGAQVMALVEEALIKRFGPYAGWAHNTLFIAELSSHKARASLCPTCLQSAIA